MGIVLVDGRRDWGLLCWEMQDELLSLRIRREEEK